MEQGMNKEKLWTKDFVTVTVINFLVFLSHFLLIVTIASYAVDEFRASTGVAGLVAGIFIIGALIGRLGTGRIIEDAGSKKVLIVGAVFFIVTSALYFAAVNLTLLIVIRLLHGIAFGAVSTATGTIVAQIIPASRRGEGIGCYGIGTILAVALGPFIGIFLIHNADFKMIFVVTSLLAAASFAMSFAVNKTALNASEPDQINAKKKFQISDYLEYKAIPISIIIMVIGFSYSGLLTFIPLYAKEIQTGESGKLLFSGVCRNGSIFASFVRTPAGYQRRQFCRLSLPDYFCRRHALIQSGHFGNYAACVRCHHRPGLWKLYLLRSGHFDQGRCAPKAGTCNIDLFYFCGSRVWHRPLSAGLAASLHGIPRPVCHHDPGHSCIHSSLLFPPGKEGILLIDNRTRTPVF